MNEDKNKSSAEGNKSSAEGNKSSAEELNPANETGESQSAAQVAANEKETVIAKKKKRLKTAIIIVISALILLYIIVNVQTWIEEKRKQKQRDELERLENKTSITFYPEDYSENIFENKVYMELNRSLKYTKGSESYYAVEGEDLSKYSYEFKFMAELLDKIIMGDAEGYNAAFVDNYWDENPNDYRESFTMQKLYRMEVEFIKDVKGDVITTDEDGTFYYVNTDLKVSYMIYHNNGSFRVDIPEDAYVPVVYKIWAKYRPGLLEPFEIKVYEVISNTKYQSGLYD